VDRLIIAALAGVGIAAVVRLADWWFRADHVGHPALFVLLSLAFWYAVSRIVLGWVNYAAVTKPDHRAAP
jgi:cellulose synthase (UDP-forming)